MNRTITSFKALFFASLKMYFRNKAAVVFTLIIPMALLAVFGFLSKGGSAAIKVNLNNFSHTQLSKEFAEAIKSTPTLSVSEYSLEEAKTNLSKGDIDLSITIPEKFGELGPNGEVLPTKITSTFNTANPQNGQAASLIVEQIAWRINSRLTNSPTLVSSESVGLESTNLNFFDFILPGILSMSIMQLGIFGTAFAFVSLKASGSLRRLQATPIHPKNFIVAQTVTRLLITLLSVSILLAFGIKFFGFHMLGSFWQFGLVSILGSLVFLGIGFAIAGYAKDENQVAPLANLIQLPMLLLSGVFFPREGFPTWLKNITDYLPLTHMADALRKIANEGASLAQTGGDIVALSIWCVVVFLVAIKVFRWE